MFIFSPSLFSHSVCVCCLGKASYEKKLITRDQSNFETKAGAPLPMKPPPHCTFDSAGGARGTDWLHPQEPIPPSAPRPPSNQVVDSTAIFKQTSISRAQGTVIHHLFIRHRPHPPSLNHSVCVRGPAALILGYLTCVEPTHPLTAYFLERILCLGWVRGFWRPSTGLGTFSTRRRSLSKKNNPYFISPLIHNPLWRQTLMENHVHKKPKVISHSRNDKNDI